MNLFKNIAARFKVLPPEAKQAEENGASVANENSKPKAEPVAEPKGPPPYIVRREVRVPVGYHLPLGETVTQAFTLVIEAGVRWHPEWKEPRITVNAWHVLPMGDALGWSGPKALAFKSLLSAEEVALVEHHGQTVTPSGKLLLDKMGLTVPAVQQTYSSFNDFRRRG